MHQKYEKMNKNGLKMIKMKYLEVRKVIQERTDVVQCERSNFDYQKECEMYIADECLSKTTGTCM